MLTIKAQEGPVLAVVIDPRLYNEDVIYKCFYWYGDNYDVDVALNDQDMFEVTLTSKTGELSEAIKEVLISKIKTDLVDFKTRDIVTKETRTIRELLIAKAFANHDAFDSDPPGEISDPVGYTPDAEG